MPTLPDFITRLFTSPSAGPSAPHSGTTPGTAETSSEAAWSVEDVIGRLRLRVFDFIVSRGVLGATCDECEGALNMKHQTCSARVNELMNSGHIVDSGGRRLTTSNRRAVVWVRNAGTVNS